MSKAGKRKVVVLGSTGSIGQSSLKVADKLSDCLEIIALAASGGNIEKLAEQVKQTGVKHVAIYDDKQEAKLKSLIPHDVRVLTGLEGLVELAQLKEADVVLVAIVGVAGLHPALAAIESGKDLAIASKEILVMAGEVITRSAQQHGVQLLPVDSEHNAIFQCLEGHKGGEKEINRLILTASGGPFRTWSAEAIQSVTLEQALEHPTWKMGPKITIDSSTLFNKGLEMIEARWLFGIGMEKIDVVIHPQSIIHSMVEFCDGSTLAQLSRTDMCFPIQYALTWPQRMAGALEPLDFVKLAKLEFEMPREDVFPALNLARQAGIKGGTLPSVYNAANEEAVQAFRNGVISFPEIWKSVEHVMAQHEVLPSHDLSVVIQADLAAREAFHGWLQSK